jgi:hypothetical protein
LRVFVNAGVYQDETLWSEWHNYSFVLAGAASS